MNESKIGTVVMVMMNVTLLIPIFLMALTQPISAYSNDTDPNIGDSGAQTPRNELFESSDNINIVGSVTKHSDVVGVLRPSDIAITVDRNYQQSLPHPYHVETFGFFVSNTSISWLGDLLEDITEANGQIFTRVQDLSAYFDVYGIDHIPAKDAIPYIAPGSPEEDIIVCLGSGSLSIGERRWDNVGVGLLMSSDLSYGTFGFSTFPRLH